MWGLLEITENKELILINNFETKKEADEEMANQVSTWTHWDKPGTPCQRKFFVTEVENEIQSEQIRR